MNVYFDKLDAVAINLFTSAKRRLLVATYVATRGPVFDQLARLLGF